MLPTAAHRTMPERATALEFPSDRPAFLNTGSFNGPPAATAVFLPRERRTSRPESSTVYLINFIPDPEMKYFARRHAYAYITPDTAPCRADPGPFIRRVFRTLALDLPQTFELLQDTCFGDMAMRFRTPDDREAAMRRQPFELDGATVKLVREGETPDVTRVTHDYVVHVALHRYPIEQRTERKIESNCSGFGFVREIDPACFAAPDLATVRLVLQLEHPREIPHELRIDYRNGSTSVVPVEMVGVWDWSYSYDANGEYVRLFHTPAA